MADKRPDNYTNIDSSKYSPGQPRGREAQTLKHKQGPRGGGKKREREKKPSWKERGWSERGWIGEERQSDVAQARGWWDEVGKIC